MRRGIPRRVYKTATFSIDRIRYVAIAVYPQGVHLGMLHKDPNNSKILIAHLCNHKVLVNGPADYTKFPLWIVPNIDSDESEQVAARCRRVGRTSLGRGFPYANSNPKDFFDSRLEFVYGSGRLGLTCASFVLAVFGSCGIHLVNYDSWQIRAGDAKWQDDFMNDMQMEDSHKQAIRSDGTMPRYAPLEVAGAIATGRRHVQFGRAVKYSKRIRLHMPL
jgi:hypothetical protein